MEMEHFDEAHKGTRAGYEGVRAREHDYGFMTGGRHLHHNIIITQRWFFLEWRVLTKHMRL